MDFYSLLAEDYDEMTSFPARIESLSKVWSDFFADHPAQSVLDAGCGTGVHSFAMARCGKKITGIDTNSKMLTIAKQHASAIGLEVAFFKHDLGSDQFNFTSTFDAVVCTGNTFVHFLNSKTQLAALNNLKKCINPGGWLLIEIINYDKIMQEKPKILYDKMVGQTRFIRSYTYDDEFINFSIEKITSNSHHIFNTRLRPVLSDSMSDLLNKAGFSEFNFYGSIKGGQFKKGESANLVVFARTNHNEEVL